MIKNYFQKILLKSGKQYQIDPNLPDRLLLHILFQRCCMLFRGILILQKKVFLGKSCTIINKGNFNFGKNVTIEKHTELDGYSKNRIKIGHGVKIGAFSKLTCTSHLSKFGIGLAIGNNSAVGDYTHFGASGGITIGENVIMGSYVSFHSENHTYTDNTKLIKDQGVTSQGIGLGNNIWVGAKVTFLDGCLVGNNCVIATGAVVKDVFPDNSVIGGVPAKIIKKIE